jgi:hypothetical protein
VGHPVLGGAVRSRRTVARHHGVAAGSGHLLRPKGRSLSVDSRSVRYYSAGEYSPFTFSVPDFRAR